MAKHRDLAPEDPQADAALGERLRAERPLPAPAFRGHLRRLIAAAPARPAWLWRRVGLAAAGGGACFAVAGLGLLGAGPLS